ncbi:MAG: GntR family transcriptional regulator [Desulfobulbaceae bacterium]|nr:GntR family transcriptional regulator [Desulfobulbaceae bacterium]
MSKKLERITLKDQAEEMVREMIQSYRFAPGKWINIERLAKDLGVSRTPVAQALKVLESEGLVSHVPNQGIRMASMTMDMAHDLYLVRGLLEGLACRLVTDKIDRETILHLEAILEEQKKIVQKEDVLAYSNSDFDFHSIIYDRCGNWLVKELLGNIKARSRPFVCNIVPILPDLFQDHFELVICFKKRDPECAEKVMGKHNDRMRKLVKQPGKRNK